eukprot:Tbor_TRINITY_DN5245_c0_g1::TRINITY_DN5245_c0_g1_i5::g.16315::m.16315/K07874/RAB1A; Ras-related protein Rab-1A
MVILTSVEEPTSPPGTADEAKPTSPPGTTDAAELTITTEPTDAAELTTTEVVTTVITTITDLPKAAEQSVSSCAPSRSDCDYVFKIIVIGDSGVGKSALTVRLSDDVFYADYASTIAIDFRMYSITVDSKHFRLQIWDTAGQERFQSMAKSYYRGANGVLLCFDLTSRESFFNLEQWMERVKQQALPGVPCMLIGCKLDETRSSPNARQVTREEAAVWAHQHNMGYIETSAKDKDNVLHAFQQITMNIFEDMKTRGGVNGKNEEAKKPSVNIGQNSQTNSSGSSDGGCEC